MKKIGVALATVAGLLLSACPGASDRDQGAATPTKVCGKPNKLEHARYEAWGDAYELELLGCVIRCGETHARCGFRDAAGEVQQYWCNGDHRCKKLPDALPAQAR